MPYDMFTFLRERGASYGFVATQNEMAKFVTGMYSPPLRARPVSCQDWTLFPPPTWPMVLPSTLASWRRLSRHVRTLDSVWPFNAHRSEVLGGIMTGLWDFIEAYIGSMPADKLPTAHANGLPARVPPPDQRWPAVRGT